MNDVVEGTLSVGAPAPLFTLPGRSGAMVSLGDYAGKSNVLVYFYPKDDTPGCTKEACSLRDGFAVLQGAEIVVLGISPDGAESHNAFAAKYNLPFELLTDADHAVHEAYGAWGQGRTIRKSFLVGKDGSLLAVFDKVDVDHHADQVLGALVSPAAEGPKEVVGKAVDAATAVVVEAKKAVEGALESQPVKEAVAAAKEAVAKVKRVKAKTAVDKAVATAEKAVEGTKKAFADASQKPAVKKAVASAKKAVASARKAVKAIEKKPSVKKAVASARKAVKAIEKKPAVKKAVASARKAVKAIERKPAVKKAVASARKAVAEGKKAVEAKGGAFQKLLALVRPKKAAPAKPAPAKKAAPARKAAAAPVRKAAGRRPSKAAPKAAPSRKAGPGRRTKRT